MNGSDIEVDVHRLSDGGLLLSYGGSSYTTYMKEEIDRLDEFLWTWFNCLTFLWLLFALLSCGVKLPRHSGKQNVRVREGKRPHGAQVALCWEAVAVRGRWQFTCFGRAALCRDWGKIEQICFFTLVGRDGFKSRFIFALLGYEDGDDSACAAVWLCSLYKETWNSFGTRMCGGPHGPRWPQLHSAGGLAHHRTSLFFLCAIMCDVSYKALFFCLRWNRTQKHYLSKSLYLS